jgi:hypothetical protein
MPENTVTRAVRDYLEEQYPGIGNACTGYQVERDESGAVSLTVRLVLNPPKEPSHG